MAGFTATICHPGLPERNPYTKLHGVHQTLRVTGVFLRRAEPQSEFNFMYYYTISCVNIFSVRLTQHHEPMDNTDHKRNVMQLSVAMGNVTLVLKGEQDLISDGSKGLYQTRFHAISDFFRPKLECETSELITVSVLV